MDWIKRHADTTVILSAVCGSLLWINGKFNDLEKRMIRMETVLIMKGIASPEMFAKEERK